MRIKKVNDDEILFDNGNIIEYDHEPDCCEVNYADFKQLEPLAYETDFDQNLAFEAVEDAGFRFGNPGKMFFVPCYSTQNGYYSRDIDIYYNKHIVLFFDAELDYN